jgi:hypothetical protein
VSTTIASGPPSIGDAVSLEESAVDVSSFTVASVASVFGRASASPRPASMNCETSFSWITQAA